MIPKTLHPADTACRVPTDTALGAAAGTRHAVSTERLLGIGRDTLTCSGVGDASLEAEVLLRHVLNLTRAGLYADFDCDISREDTERYWQLVERRLAGEPTAYITGRREFYGLDFQVDRRVLIPRPESELLVERAIGLAHGGAMSFADIGTGSGAIAISLAVNLPRVKVYATDISGDALEVARLNCRKHGVEDRVRLFAGDLLEALPEPVDVMAANLPYVRKSELSLVNTHGYEPSLALDGGYDGLDTIGRMAAQVSGRLNPGGTVLLEIGYGQDEEAIRILRERFPDATIEVMPDLGGIPRVVAVTIPRQTIP